MSNETLLYICGIVLALSAVTVSFIGLRVKSFPGKAMPLVVLWFAIFVVGSTTFAVLHAKDEDASKAKEAKFEEANKKAEEEQFEQKSGGAPSEGEGHEEEGSEEAGAEESPEEAEEGAEESGSEGGGAEESSEEGEEGAATQGGAAEGGAEAGGDPEAGAQVFADNCSVCHGTDGHGGNGGPDLRTMPKAKTEAGAVEQVTNGGGGMPPFGGVLSEEEIQNVAAFVVQKVVGAS